ncbi:MAG: RidA family protein [Acidimicrobiia bacterium]|nr:RidA family protein [Acidimicrobiia bacterium]
MALEKLDPTGVHEPQGYSHAVIATGTRTVYTAGQVGVDAGGRLVGDGDLQAQSAQAFANLRTGLEAAGATLADVAHLRIYVVGMTPDSLGPVVGGALEAVGADFPVTAATMIGVASLIEAGALIEVEAVAVID